MTLTIPAHFHRAKVVNFYFFLQNFENNDFPGAQPPILFRSRPPNDFPSNSKCPKIKKNFFEKKKNNYKFIFQSEPKMSELFFCQSEIFFFQNVQIQKKIIFFFIFFFSKKKNMMKKIFYSNPGLMWPGEVYKSAGSVPAWPRWQVAALGVGP